MKQGSVITCTNVKLPCGCSSSAMHESVFPKIGHYYRVRDLVTGTCEICKTKIECILPVEPFLENHCWPKAFFSLETPTKLIIPRKTKVPELV